VTRLKKICPKCGSLSEVLPLGGGGLGSACFHVPRNELLPTRALETCSVCLPGRSSTVQPGVVRLDVK
jgi:hypothetical protein